MKMFQIYETFQITYRASQSYIFYVLTGFGLLSPSPMSVTFSVISEKNYYLCSIKNRLCPDYVFVKYYCILRRHSRDIVGFLWNRGSIVLCVYFLS